MSGECNLLSSVLSQQKFEVTDVKAVGRSMLSDSPCYSSWTNELYLENKGKYILKPRGPADSKDTKRRERENKCARVGERDPRPFGSSVYVFFPPPGLPYVNWASHECCLFYLRSSLSPRTFLCSIFTGFSLPRSLATAILDSFFLF